MCLFFVPLLLLAPLVLAAVLVVAAAPAATVYLLLTDPEQFGEFWVGWLLALPVSPFQAYWLAGLRPAVTRRLRALRREEREVQQENPALDQAARRRRLLRTGLVLPATGLSGLVAIQTMINDQNRISLGGFVVLQLVVPVTALALGALFWAWDRR